MLDVVSNAIDRFYKKKDYSTFKFFCEKPLIIEELQQCFNLHRFKITGGIEEKDYPSKDWYIHFDNYKKGEFEVSYKTFLQISKVAPLFYIQHQFSVVNKDEDRMTPKLQGSDNQSYTKTQAELHDEISSILIKKKYYELKYADFNETVEGLKMPEAITIFGPNVTVEHLLFVDIFNICDSDSN